MTDLEYEHVENKRSFAERHDATIAIAAFATAGGGVVRFGIDPDGKRVGVQVGRTSLEELANQIRQNTDPPQYPSITVDGEETSAVVLVRIEESPIKPVWAFGKPYKRVGRTNQSLSREETQRLVEVTTGRTWDALPCQGLTGSALDRRAIEDYLKRSNQAGDTETNTVLENLRLRLPDGSLCNAAALLFATNPTRFVDGAQVKCARFSGTTSVNFIDERTIEASLLVQLDEALAFIARNTRQGIRITGRPERETVPEYPPAALREAITNAICHRDYAKTGTTQVRIYEDRLEIWNPATLPADLTIEQLYEEHPSRPRNRRLADAFYRARLIEQWGTGTLRMVSAFDGSGLARPEYRYEMGTFIVCFTSAEILQTQSTEMTFNVRQRDVIANAATIGPLTRRKYAERFGISERTAQRDLDELVRDGRYVREGRGPATSYSRRE